MKTTAPKMYGADDARARLPELLERAHHGSATVITKRGRPYAVLVPIGSVDDAPRLSLASMKGSGVGLWGTDSSATIDTLRSQWE